MLLYSLDSVSNLIRQDLCPSALGTLRCNATSNTTFSPVVSESLYGIKRAVSDKCEYKY